ncbi:MAG: hypothetical protein JWO72_1643 [Caulobacteraceae bacterium]|nr:hypothetical protein [Caulobacteraceae bacterium]
MSALQSSRKIRPQITALGAAIVLQALAAAPSATAQAQAAAAFDLKAPGVDMSGVWMIEHYVGSGAPIQRRILHDANGNPAPFLPWAQKIYDKNIEEEKKGHTFAGGPTFCLPHGMPQMMTAATYPVEIFQSARDFAFVHELQRNYRIIHLDRGHLPPDDITPNYMGDSVGRWEGDTMVVDTTGLSDKTTFDMLGAPHTDKLHIVERIRMLNKDQWEDRITIDDPGTFSHPWEERVTYRRAAPGDEVMEYICLDGNRNKVVNGMVTIDGKPRDGAQAAARTVARTKPK